MTDPALWQIVFPVTPATAERFATAIEPFCRTVGWFEDERSDGWRVEGIVAAPFDPAPFHAATGACALGLGVHPPAVRFAALPVRDWVRDTLASFRPIRAGRYRVQGSHVAETGRDGAGIALTIDAGLAFGTGEHATTQGCLRALDALARRRRFRSVLDLGCGTGVLALAAAATWPQARVTASDIDPEAVTAAHANARRNRLGGRVSIVLADGLAQRRLSRRAPFDLALANILARPLIRLARSLSLAVAPGGILVLSGVIAADAAWVMAPYRAQGFRLARRFDVNGWATLVMRKGNGGRDRD